MPFESCFVHITYPRVYLKLVTNATIYTKQKLFEEDS